MGVHGLLKPTLRLINRFEDQTSFGEQDAFIFIGLRPTFRAREPQEDDWSKTKVYEGVTRLFRENLLQIIIKVLPVAFEEVPTTVSPSDTIIFLFLLFWFSSTEGRILIVRVRTENQKSPIFDWKKEDYDGWRPSVGKAAVGCLSSSSNLWLVLIIRRRRKTNLRFNPQLPSGFT